jgi:hypothetical protein
MRGDISEYQKVEEVARKFIEGVRTGKSEILKGIFHEQACMFGRLSKDVTQEGTINNLYEGVDKVGPCKDDYVARVDILSLEKSVAIVKVIEDNWHGYKFTDYLTLWKKDNEWKIVAKVYDTLSEK